jgi:glycosyltransferase involved in cell wall biosynthesis
VLYVVHALIAERVQADASPHGPIATRHRIAVERTALREADWVVPVSRSTAAVCRAEGAAEARLRVRHNAIDLPSALRPPYDETTRDVDLLYVGRLSTEKGVETLLEAVRLLGAPLRLTVVGDGPLEPAVRETAAELPGRVALLGALPHAEVLALFRRARLAVVPSYSEPFGFVVLEAFTQGTPVVAADTGGIPEIADDASGAVLVPPRDAPALARAIARLAAAPAERAALSHAAYERAQVFAFERAGPETVALYRACADAGRATPPGATGDAPRGGAGAARPEPAR